MGAVEAAKSNRVRWWRRPRWWLAGVGLAVVLALAAAAALSWRFSSQVLVPVHEYVLPQAEVRELPPGRIVLERTEESERPGVYGLEWLGGHAIAGPILGETDDTVTRELRDPRGYLVPELGVGFEADTYSGDPLQALGVPFSTVEIPGELGPMPAWEVGGRSRTWAIVVHGINGTPQTGLRVVPALRETGLPALLISYREDRGAPASPDGFHHLGLTEWRDLQAAARHALRHGARRLILVGYSMGGALVTQFMQKSPLADRVDGLVLDAPVLDWRQTLEFNATEMGFPAFAAKPLEWAIGARIEVDWDSLDALRHSDDLRLPILLFHGEDDVVVPIATSEDLAAALPNHVAFHPAPRAGHVEAWNVNPRLYERRLLTFLREWS